MLTTSLKLGFGAGHIGSPDQIENDVFDLLDDAVGLGITFFDTACGYGASEERLGRWLAANKHEVTIVSKCGYSVPGYDDWTPECIAAGIDLALSKLGANHLDGMVLHSCPIETLKREGLMEALQDAKAKGKVRAIGYSGENEALAFAASTGLCDILETSVNLFDQWSLRNVLPHTRAFVIAKRPLANVCWTHAEEPIGKYAHSYWLRMQDMPLEPLLREAGLSWTEAALRFSAFAPNVSCAIVGTSSKRNLEENRQTIEKGPLAESVVHQVMAAYEATGLAWPGEV